MKVLFTFFNPSGGMETLNRVRCAALTARGIECHMLYTHYGEGRRNIRNFPVHLIHSNEDISNLLFSQQFDLIVVNSDIDLAEQIRNLGYKGLMVYELQGLGELEEAREVIANYAGRISLYTDALLYPETEHLQQLLGEYLPAMPHYCFDNPVGLPYFEYTAYPPKNYPVLAWIGRIQVNKNWKEFLQIGIQLLSSQPEMYLWIFQDDTLADPEEKARFDQFVAETGIASKLILYSNIPHEHMADYLSIIGDSGGLLCSTSILEGFGYAVAEAMLCRCPVLSTDSDGIRRLVIHNQTGKIYSRGNIEEATSEALSLMNNQVFRTYVRNAAEKHVRDNLNPELYVTRFLTMYTSLSGKINR
ncbi:glycosyltransferase family 4 protein [Paenibacillus sp. F6_3S_P_1C]|uniref:Glycosyltransferase family 4 protein n=1 Tax=Paenibacillus vandeheii TaxID=3035917 RepID=A0ABT8JIT4_9BACL|nr:glycosyltransferase family 4 protein [Paenibacillus vandeheii]MDN4605035.1 glycosyltransferase family 4 protein [Paenibacillus vandeheii]